jgi:hypothetical protein
MIPNRIAERPMKLHTEFERTWEPRDERARVVRIGRGINLTA